MGFFGAIRMANKKLPGGKLLNYRRGENFQKSNQSLTDLRSLRRKITWMILSSDFRPRYFQLESSPKTYKEQAAALPVHPALKTHLVVGKCMGHHQLFPNLFVSWGSFGSSSFPTFSPPVMNSQRSCTRPFVDYRTAQTSPSDKNLQRWATWSTWTTTRA